MGGSLPSQETFTSLDQVKTSAIIQEVVHPVFGKIAISNCVFTNGKKGLAYRKDIMIESNDLGQKLIEYSKNKDLNFKKSFLMVYGYSIEKHKVSKRITLGNLWEFNRCEHFL